MTLRSGFLPRVVVTEPARLFGHNRPHGLLDNLCIQLRMGTNTEVVGERGSGKTSLLECSRVVLREQAQTLLPVLVSYEERITDPTGAYHHFIAATQAEVCRLRGPGAAHLELPGVQFPGAPDVNSNLEKLRALDAGTTPTAFSRLLESLTQQGLGLVLMIDEHEYYLHRAFGGDVMGFWVLRQLATHGVPQGAPKPLTVLVAGVKSWGHLCEGQVPSGSPVPGMFTNRVYVGPLGRDDLTAMWLKCQSESDEGVRERLRQAKLAVEDVHDLVGGWPFYCKLVGQHLITDPDPEEEDLLEQLQPHLDTVWKERTVAEQEQLLAALSGQAVGNLRDLENRGLIERYGESCRPRGRLWATYLEQRRPAAPPRGL